MIDDPSLDLDFLHSIPTLKILKPAGDETEILRHLSALYRHSRSRMSHPNLSKMSVIWSPPPGCSAEVVLGASSRVRAMMLEQNYMGPPVPRVFVLTESDTVITCLNDVQVE